MKQSNLTLKSFSRTEHRPDKWEFQLELSGESQTIILKEKSHWPMIHGENIAKVQDWLFRSYGELCYRKIRNDYERNDPN